MSKSVLDLYDNLFARDNVYGHALDLLKQLAGSDGIHLDIGCGFGRIAEPLEAETKLKYVGIDSSENGISSLHERGFESHRYRFCDADEDYRFVAGLLQGRKLASISVIDVLEHIEDASGILCCLKRLAQEHGVGLILSVPNVAHKDVGFKLAFGRWEYTDAGLLDKTHVRFFTEASLSELMRRLGWLQVFANDVQYERSDQHFPDDHLALAEHSVIHQVLVGLREQVDGSSRTNQFVRAYVPWREMVSADGKPTSIPFLSVVTRTQGRRIDTLREVLLCLTAQSCQDYEVIVVGHKLDISGQLAIEALIESLPDWQKDKTRFLRVDHGERAAPLNAGFEAATGRYITALDDDDLIFAHWVEEFRKLAEKYPGQVLRAASVRQVCKGVKPIFGNEASRAASGFFRDYPATFDLYQHLNDNFSPNFSVAFPRSAFHDFRIRYDETLSTAEDWDYLMRVAFLCGVASTDEITGIYRWWEDKESSRTLHHSEQWLQNAERIRRKHDLLPMVLPMGSVRRLRNLYLTAVAMGKARSDDGEGSTNAGESLSGPRMELHKLLDSSSWRITRPFRWLWHKILLRTNYADPVAYAITENEQAASLVEEIRNSTSWKLAKPMRAVKGLLLRWRMFR